MKKNISIILTLVSVLVSAGEPVTRQFDLAHEVVMDYHEAKRLSRQSGKPVQTGEIYVYEGEEYELLNGIPRNINVEKVLTANKSQPVVPTLKIFLLQRIKCLVPSNGMDNGTAIDLVNVVIDASRFDSDTRSNDYGKFRRTWQEETWEDYYREQLDLHGFVETVFGDDDVYLKLNGSQIWPNEDEVEMGQFDARSFNRMYLALEGDGSTFTFKIKDYDLTSSNDLLGTLEIDSDHPAGKFIYLLRNRDEGSAYSLQIEVVDYN